METFVEIYGWMCAGAGSIAGIPQVLRLIKARTSAGVSLLMWQLNVAMGIAWAVHGFIVARMNVLLPNLLVAGLAAIVVWMIATDRALNHLRVWGLVVVTIVVLAGTEFGAGPVWFGLLLAIPAAFSFLAQLKDLMQRPDLRGVSLGTLAMLALVQAMWLSWSLIAGDISVTLVASVALVLTVANLVVFQIRGRTLRKAAVALKHG